jgi:hypothetical protein
MSADVQHIERGRIRRQDPAVIGGRTAEIRITMLLAADSPRLGGEDGEHVQVLAALDTPLPPILVHRRTLRVIDGMHRLRAASARGQDTIAVEFFDGTEEEAFVRSVEANIAHGLPLTLADREAAAARIIGAYPQRSNRWIASVTGLAAGTVAMIRRRTTGPHDHRGMMRIGRDGRIRPVSSAEGRRLARDMIKKRPEASLREIAKLAGISPGTVRDVRERLRRGDDPVPARESANGRPRAKRKRAAATPRATKDCATMLQDLRKDPSLRFTESGRALLRWLDAKVTGLHGLRDMVMHTPPHCRYFIAGLARRCAEEWLELAMQLEDQLDKAE